MDWHKLLMVVAFATVIIGTGLVIQNSIAQEYDFSGASEDIKIKVNRNVPFDSTSIQGHVTAKVYDQDGNLIQYSESDNLVVDVGLDGIVDRVFGSSLQSPNAIFDYLHIGTGNTFAPNATQTSLESPQGGACVRVQDASVATNSATTGETTATVEASFDGGDCAGAIVEAGVFNNATAGVMLARSTFGSVTIGSGDTLTVSYEITIT